MNEQRARTRALILASFFIGFGFLFLVSPDQRFFAYENRYLTSQPEFSLDDFLAGTFTKKFETYVTDQFPGRMGWLQLKGLSEFLAGKAENNAVFFGSDGFLFEKLSYNESQWQQNVERLAQFASWLATDLPTTQAHFALVPTSSVLFPEQLPLFAEAVTAKQTQLLTEFEQRLPNHALNVVSTLMNHRDEAIYFATDHHWTQLGAFYGYEVIAKAFELTPQPRDFWQWQTVSTRFFGSYFAKASLPWVEADTITAAHSPTPLVLTNLETQQVEPLYSSTYLQRSDQYGYFLNGTPSFVEISNPQAQTSKRLVILKDSYSHVIAPLLAEHYASVTLIDLRFFNRPIREYLTTEQFDDLLFIAGTTTFNTDLQLGKLAR
ncbi:MAG: DHHW family protein [Culicoidibacterales bacterium]